MAVNKQGKPSSTTPYLAAQGKKSSATGKKQEVKPALATGTAVAAKRSPAKKSRPRPAERTGASLTKPQGKGRGGASMTETPAPIKMMLRPRSFEDDAYIMNVTQEEMAPIFRASYGYDLDMPMVMSYIQSSNTRMILVDDKVAGYVSYVADDSGKLNIGSLVFASEYQGKGYGTRVMRQIEQEARAMGIAELEVFIQQTNTRSQAFAESLGYTRVQSMQPQTVVMVKNLQPVQPVQPQYPGQYAGQQGYGSVPPQQSAGPQGHQSNVPQQGTPRQRLQ